MIHISQGHERSISLEILLRSLLLLSKNQTSKLVLHCDLESLKENLSLLNFDFTIKENYLMLYEHCLKLKLVDTTNSNPSFASLNSALNTLQKDDVLVTLPTSKDQFPNHLAGHTEYFRHFYQNQDLAMTFYDGENFTLLITDHIPLKDVSTTIDSDLIYQKTTFTLEGMTRYFRRPKYVLFSGINPHAGENGQLGHEENQIHQAKEKLQKQNHNIQFMGPSSGDTLHNFRYPKGELLTVYMHHDQGLAPFKQKNLFWGSNITLGLPFLRLSVDHGTAFDLYGKRKAQFLGCYDVLLTALKADRSTHDN